MRQEFRPLCKRSLGFGLLRRLFVFLRVLRCPPLPVKVQRGVLSRCLRHKGHHLPQRVEVGAKFLENQTIFFFHLFVVREFAIPKLLKTQSIWSKNVHRCREKVKFYQKT